MDALEALEHLDGYRRLFFDPVFWAPYVESVCQRHGFELCDAIHTGVPGTCPVFIVNQRWLVKFFGRLFDGAKSFTAEMEAGRLASRAPDIPIARILASGSLFPADHSTLQSSWHWPYLVYEFIPGKSIGELAGLVSETDWLRIAGEMGGIVRQLHGVPVDQSTVFPNQHEPYLEFLQAQKSICVQNQRTWGTLPAHLIDQIEAFLPPLVNLVDRSRPPHLIHADLTRDHLLGQVIDGRWVTLALIDFGDAMTGDLLYELAALHLDLFQGEKRRLAAFLDAYGMPESERKQLPRRALATSLLHRFNVLSGLPAEMMQAQTLEELAARIWDTRTG